MVALDERDRAPEGGAVAYDVHVRRVFLRAGLVDRDTPAAIDEAARRMCPEEPSLLDLPTWTVGREWCRPREPKCDDCPIGAVCERHTERGVEGVGTRR